MLSSSEAGSVAMASSLVAVVCDFCELKKAKRNCTFLASS